MNREEINNRQDVLSAVLVHDTLHKKKLLTTGERIVINQEVSSLLQQINVLDGTQDEAWIFKVPENIEKKITELSNKIEHESKRI